MLVPQELLAIQGLQAVLLAVLLQELAMQEGVLEETISQSQLLATLVRQEFLAEVVVLCVVAVTLLT
jgi:hypothetical protein